MNNAPMLGSVRMGDAPGESSWDRQDYQAGYILRSRADRAYQDRARRGLKRTERVDVAAEIAADLLPEVEVEVEAIVLEDEGELDLTWLADFRCDYDVPAEDFDALTDVLDAEPQVNNRLAALFAEPIDDSEVSQLAWAEAGYGDGIFSTDDLTWGYRVTTRP